MPATSRAAQSMRVWGGKVRNGWPSIIRNIPQLIGRFVFGRMDSR
ncbi:MAG TPA: hypothetical protein VMT61_17110 [Candidatus Binataceae bacterium]|nr:hypothetical protein [Candidatus Binataceae bacterium]